MDDVTDPLQISHTLSPPPRKGYQSARHAEGGKGHACSLLLSTLINVCIGLTPFIDNFMHMGGLVAGLVIGGMHALLQETP